MKTRKIESPCIGCKYFSACGDIERTEPCEGKEEEKE